MKERGALARRGSQENMEHGITLVYRMKAQLLYYLIEEAARRLKNI
jgi:hypothetical protein